MNNNPIPLDEKIRQLLEEVENFDVWEFIDEIEDGKQVFRFQEMLKSKSRVLKSAPKTKNTQKFIFHNGQSVTIGKDGYIIRVKS